MKTIIAIASLSLVLGSAVVARADIFEWEYINPGDPALGKQESSTLVPDGVGIDAVPFASLKSRDLTMAYLIGADLTGASFWRATLTEADLSQANLTGAYFYLATLTDADLTGADMRGAYYANLSGAIVTHLIGPDGTITGLHLSAGQTLLVRDYDGNPNASSVTGPIPITVEEHFLMDAGGVLELRLNDTDWGSTIGFQSGVSPQLGDTLQLGFDPTANRSGLVGTTFDLFDWGGPLDGANRFDEISLPENTDGTWRNSMRPARWPCWPSPSPSRAAGC